MKNGYFFSQNWHFSNYNASGADFFRQGNFDLIECKFVKNFPLGWWRGWGLPSCPFFIFVHFLALSFAPELFRQFWLRIRPYFFGFDRDPYKFEIIVWLSAHRYFLTALGKNCISITGHKAENIRMFMGTTLTFPKLHSVLFLAYLLCKKLLFYPNSSWKIFTGQLSYLIVLH